MGVCFGLAWLVGVAGWPPNQQHKTRPHKRGTTLTAAVDVISTSSFQTAIVTTAETKDNEKKKEEEEEEKEKEKGTDN